jgi:hypothetical protein
MKPWMSYAWTWSGNAKPHRLTMRSTSLEVRQVPTTEHSQPDGICQILRRFLAGSAGPADAAGNGAGKAAVSGRSIPRM